MQVNLKSFKQKVARNVKQLRSFLSKLERRAPKGLDNLAEFISPQVWAETDCLSCANCCKVMTPTFTKSDLKRISAHFNMTEKEFYDTWLEKQLHHL